MAVTLTNSQLSAGLYSAFWNRAPDATGQNFWVNKLNTGAVTPLEMANAAFAAPEGFAAYPASIRQDKTALVTQVYNSVFNRAPDAGGLAFWTAQLTADSLGNVTNFPQIVLNMMYSALNSAAAGNTDGMQFQNEISVGIFVAETLRTDDPAVTSVAFQGVTYEASSVAIREAQLAEMVAPVYTLTTNIDTVNVTVAGLNSVQGLFASTANNGTYNTGDTINGNGLTNVALVVNATAAQTVVADVNDVASINVNLAVSAAGAAAKIDMVEFDNVAQVAITQGSNAQVLELSDAQTDTAYAINVARTVTVDLLSFESDTAAGTTVDLSVNGAGVSASRTAGTQVYANLATVDFNGAATTDVENIDIATSGNNYLRLLDTADLEVLTITGSGNNTIEVGSGVATLEVDASAATGNNTIDLLDNLSVGASTTVLGGSGTDTVRGILNAGTTAATLTGVEAVGLTFGTVGSFFTAVNADALATVSVIDSTAGGAIDASDEAVNLTALSDVTTLNIASTGTTTADAVNVAYVSGTKGDLTVNVGASYDDVDVGTLTVTNLTGALTVNGAGAAKYGLVDVANVTDEKATSVNVNATTSSIDVSGAVTAAAAAEYSLSAVAGLTADVNRIDIGHATKDVTVASLELSATGLDSTGTTGSTVVTNLNAITTAGTLTVDLVTLTSDADGVVSFTATQQTALDDVTVAVVDATGAVGDGVVINLADLDTNGSTVSTGAGSATVSLTQAADTFNGGAGNVTVTTVDGADTVNGGAGVDTVVLSTSNDGIEWNSFAAGKNGDVAVIDISGWNSPVNNAGVAIVATTAAVVDAETAGAAWTYNAGNILVLEGVVANDAALTTELDTFGAMAALGATDIDIIVAYFDGYSTQIRTVEVDTALITGDISGSVVTANGAELVGVNTADLVSGNFGAFVV